MSTLPDAGFYQDPHDPGLERWWNGRTWVGQTRKATGAPPLPMVVVPEVGSPQVSESKRDEQRSGYFVAAWVSVIFCAPLAIVFNLMDNSICKARGVPPTFAPMIVALILWVVTYILLAPSLS